MLLMPIRLKIKVEEYKANENRKFDQKINRTNAVSMTQDILIAVFLRKQFDKALNAFDKIVAGIREIIRPGRSNLRKKRPKQRYSINYKRL